VLGILYLSDNQAPSTKHKALNTKYKATIGLTAMGLLNFLTRAELEKFGPPTPEEFSEIGVSQTLLCDLTLKHLSLLQNPTAVSLAARLHLPAALIEELLYQLYMEKLIEMRLQNAGENTRYAMLDTNGARGRNSRNELR
jgi:hypothetical protein